jgi:hypothetical protein
MDALAHDRGTRRRDPDFPEVFQESAKRRSVSVRHAVPPLSVTHELRDPLIMKLLCLETASLQPPAEVRDHQKITAHAGPSETAIVQVLGELVDVWSKRTFMHAPEG